MQPVPMLQRDDLIAFFDTETSDKPDFKMRSDDPAQPHIVEGCVLLFTPDGELVIAYDALVKPDGWTISAEAAAVHGHTVESLAVGVPEAVAVDGMLSVLDRAALRVAHNRNFDDRILRIAIKRFYSDERAEQFKARPGECTALLSKPVCQLPATEAMKKTNFKNSYKTPTLAEAFAHLTGGKQLEDAHSARGDALACARVYFLLKGVRMPAYPDDAQALREEQPRLPQGKDECDAAQTDLVELTEGADDGARSQ